MRVGVRFPQIHEFRPKTKIMEQIILIDELYQKRIKLACDLLGLSEEVANDLAETMGSDEIFDAIVSVAHMRNRHLGLRNYYNYEHKSPGVGFDLIRRYSASHIVDGMYDVVLTEEKDNHLYRCSRCRILEKKVMSGEDFVKLMESLNYTLVEMRCN